MATEGCLLLVLDSLLVLLFLLLFLDHLEEGIAFGLGLLSVHDLLLQELFLAGLLKFSGQHLLSDQFILLSLSGLSLTFFIGAFRSQSIDFALSISCTLLEFSKALDLLLLLVS